MSIKYSTGALIRLEYEKLYKTYSKSKFKATSKYSDKDINKALILH